MTNEAGANTLGCKGDEPCDAHSQLLILEDDNVFGALKSQGYLSGVINSPSRKSEIINETIPGASLATLVERYQQLITTIKPRAIMVYGGWVDVATSTSDERGWRAAFDAFEGDHELMLCTLMSAITPECRERGVSSLLRSAGRSDPALDGLWQNITPSNDECRRILDRLHRFNTFILSYASEKGDKVIDLYSALLPKRYEDIPLNFLDAGRLRNSAYPAVAQAVLNVISGPNKSDKKTGFLSRWFGKQDAKEQEGRDETQNIYPLW